MFTGLVDDVGTIERVASSDAGRELRIACRYNDLRAGESIAVNGACLTVREPGTGVFTAAAVNSTLDVTAIGSWAAGQRVNLERAMRPSDRFGGHIVQGHVDGVARVTRAERDGDSLRLDLALPPGLSELMVARGSITVDGVSLTIIGLPGPDAVQLSIIEHTLRHTTLGALKAGDRVHVEADVIAKHVRRLLEGTRM
ncbi:MAG TPA: riboflavin synthase [Gemmatimonadaceae bacterium]|nr:riboflavin synthase [Gemmatimonadaceae bacterium]